jgi:hypothetical protein
MTDFYLFQEGSAASSQNTTENYFISPTGAVIWIERDQKRLRFLTCALPQIFHKQVLKLVEFRNRHVHENLYVTEALGNHVDLLMEV